VRYADWCETVLRAVVGRPDNAYMFGMPHLAVALGVKAQATWGDAAERDVDTAIISACDDLEQIGLIETKHWTHVAPTLQARPYRKESLRGLWPRLGVGDLDPDEERFLHGIAALSEAEHEDYAESRWIVTSEAFERLGWEWDRGRSLALIKVLDAHLFIAKRLTVGDSHNVRIRLAGAVRYMDEVGNMLIEARDHLAAGRLRAAGCVCGVELERALKNLCVALDADVRARLPTIADYNDALKAKKAYQQPTWRKIQHLADLRNKCAHVLDEEPSDADVRELLVDTDGILRDLHRSPDSA
jgi:hypothetical protein